jgi:hypothetical protein
MLHAWDATKPVKIIKAAERMPASLSLRVSVNTPFE